MSSTDHNASTPKGMSEEQLERLLADEIESALGFIYAGDHVAAQRDRNYDYYRGVLDDLPPARGRSRVTDRAVSTYINMMLPGLLRVFTAGRDIAEFEPTGAEDEELAKFVTRYVNDVVFRKDNRGELLLYQWAFDALVQKVGVIKAWWHEERDAREETFFGLTDDEFTLIGQQAEQSGAEVIAHSRRGKDGGHDVTVRRVLNRSRVSIENVPPEEFVIDRDARTLEDAVLVSHRTTRRTGELIDQGYPADIIDDLPTDMGHRLMRHDDARRTGPPDGSSVDPMLREVAIHEGIVRCDYDGEGVRPWYFVAGGGDGKVKVLKMEPYAHQIVFADFCPNPLPHTFWGRCPADDLAEIQKVNTVLLRQMLDNLYLSNTPQREVVQDWIVKPDQLLNLAPGTPILVKQPGAIREVSIPFTAGAALQAIQYFESVAESRTGVSKQAAGLDPDTLQNQSATAASLAYSASMGKLEMIARIWAHGGMRKLFRGILNILVRYQDFERIVRMDGRARAVDPRDWAAFSDMDVTVNTGLGTGARERDMAFLATVLQQQKEIIETLGPDNPIVGVRQIVTTLHKAAEAAGITNPQAFFRDPGDWTPPSPEPAPSPDAAVMANLELKKLEQKNIEAAQTLRTQERIAARQAASNERIALAGARGPGPVTR